MTADREPLRTQYRSARLTVQEAAAQFFMSGGGRTARDAEAGAVGAFGAFGAFGA